MKIKNKINNCKFLNQIIIKNKYIIIKKRLNFEKSNKIYY